MDMKTKIRITVTVETYVNVAEGEDIKNRQADIYLHDSGKFGHRNKKDLGGDVKIEVISDLKEKEYYCVGSVNGEGLYIKNSYIINPFDGKILPYTFKVAKIKAKLFGGKVEKITDLNTEKYSYDIT